MPVAGSLEGAQHVVFSESGEASPPPGIRIRGSYRSSADCRGTRGGAGVRGDQADGLAVSDNGRVLAVRTLDRSGGARRRSYSTVSRSTAEVGPDEPDPARQAAAVGGAVDIRFVAGSRDLLIATSKSVLLWRTTAKAPVIVAEGFDGLRAAWLSPDRQSLYGVQGQLVLVRELELGIDIDLCLLLPAGKAGAAGEPRIYF